MNPKHDESVGTVGLLAIAAACRSSIIASRHTADAAVRCLSDAAVAAGPIFRATAKHMPSSGVSASITAVCLVITLAALPGCGWPSRPQKLSEHWESPQ